MFIVETARNIKKYFKQKFYDFKKVFRFFEHVVFFTIYIIPENFWIFYFLIKLELLKKM